MIKTVYASEVAKLDSNVHTGGGTDDTAALQAVLDTAPNYAGLKLIIDGAALVTGLKLYSNTTIECPNADCGLYLADGANDSILSNAHYNNYEIIDENITLIGGTYNHNSPNQVHTVFGASGYDNLGFGKDKWVITFEFYGIRNLTMKDLTIANQRTFAMLIQNWYRVNMENISIVSPHGAHAQNQDGIHFWGPGRFLTMRNISGWSGDDFIALAPDEHDNKSSIEDVLIDGVMLENADQGIRLLCRDKGKLDRVFIRNVTGTYTTYGFYINPWFPGAVGSFGNIVIENVDLRRTEPQYDYTDPFMFCIGGKFDSLTLKNIYDIENDGKKFIRVGIANFDQLDLTKHSDHGTYMKQFIVDGLNVIKSEGCETVDEYIEVDAKIDVMRVKNVTMTKNGVEGEAIIRTKENADIGALILTDNYLEDGDVMVQKDGGNIGKIIEN